jgi:hypothetical protein
MFVLPLDIHANGEEEPPALEAAFGELFTVLAPLAGDRDPVTLTETLWCALHGMAVLADSPLLRQDHREQRLDLLLDHLTQH